MNRHTFASFFVSLSVALALASAGAAQEPPRTAVLQTAVGAEADAGLGAAVERVIRARVDALGVVTVAETPPLSLPDVQLAVGCVAETEACLAMVTGQLGVDALLLPTVDRADSTLVVGITFFDSRNGGSSRRTVRRASGDDAVNELLGSVDGMLREIFGLPPAEEPPDISAYVDGDGSGAAAAGRPGAATGAGGGAAGGGTPPDRSMSPVPFIVAAAGGALLVGGGVLGLVAKATEDEYAATSTRTREGVDEAIELRESAETQAMIANVLFGVGGAALVVGAVLLVLELDSGTEAEPAGDVAIAPVVGPGLAGVAIGGRL